MNHPLADFLTGFWIGSVLTIGFGALLFFVLRRRELWLRYVGAEAAFWVRIGVPARIAEATRRFGAGRPFIVLLGLAVALCLLLALANGGAYVYFNSQLQPPRGPDIPIIDLPAPPPD